MQKDIIVVGRFEPLCKNHTGLIAQAKKLGNVFVAVGQPNFERARATLTPNKFSHYQLNYPFGFERIDSWLSASVGGTVQAIAPVRDIFSESGYARHVLNAFSEAGHKLENPVLFSGNKWTIRCFANYGISNILPKELGFHASDVRKEIYKTGSSGRLACTLTPAELEKIRHYERIRKRIGSKGELIYDGFLTLIKQVRKGGVREILMPKDAVLALFIDRDDNVWFIRQFREALGKKFLGIPAEVIGKPGKSILQHAVEGLFEEIGIKIDPSYVKYATSYYSSEGHSTELVHLFVAKGPYEFVGQHLEPGENIEIVKIPFMQAVAMARKKGRLGPNMPSRGGIMGPKTAVLILNEYLDRVEGKLPNA